MEYTLSKESASLFESIKHIDENGVEFWFGRELAPYLGYAQWRNFESVIEKAKDACKTASGTIENDFADVSKIVRAGAMEKPVEDVKLTRYACYLIAQNGDPRKKEIAEAQTYFAIQTRYAEIQQMQEYQHLTTEEEMPYTATKALPKSRRFLTTWAAQNLPPISSVPHRQKKSSERKTYRERTRRMLSTTA